MFGRSTGSFDRLLEKATSQLLLEPDWTSIMMICDSIRQGDTNAKYAVTAIKKKFYHQNPHAALYAMQVMESCVKNCGVLIHDEIATKQFMEEMRELVKQTTDDNIKNKVLELIQIWGTAFRNSPKYRIVTDTLHLMQAEGWKFPPVREAEAMFEADTAPEWAEGEVCHRCRVQFSTFTRQHHCRACGQVFCGKCSGKSCVLPKFGIEREVRVCDSCFDKYGPKEPVSPTLKPVQSGAAGGGGKEGDLPAEYLASPLSKQTQEVAKPGKSEAELKEEEELQLVLALSKSEAEEKEKLKKKATSDILAGFGQNKPKANTNGVSKSPEESTADPELEKYLNRDYWENKSSTSSTAETGEVGRARDEMPVGVSAAKEAVRASGISTRDREMIQGSGNPDRADEEELDEFTVSLRTQLEIFVNRMKSNSSRGRPIANDTSVQTLFMNVMAMHSKLVKYIQEQEDTRVHYEGLQDKLSQVKDARAALDALREEERERRRREAEEAERQRQIQLAKKLEVMRKKKAEYLEYQRQVALQRMAEQEREMAKIQEANKQTYLQQQQGMYSMYLPYGYGAPQAYPPNAGQMMPPPPGGLYGPPGVPGGVMPPAANQQQGFQPVGGAGGMEAQSLPQQSGGPPAGGPMGAAGGGYQTAPAPYYPPTSVGGGVVGPGMMMPQQPQQQQQQQQHPQQFPTTEPSSVPYNMQPMMAALPSSGMVGGQPGGMPAANQQAGGNPGDQSQQPIMPQENVASLISFD